MGNKCTRNEKQQYPMRVGIFSKLLRPFPQKRLQIRTQFVGKRFPAKNMKMKPANLQGKGFQLNMVKNLFPKTWSWEPKNDACWRASNLYPTNVFLRGIFGTQLAFFLELFIFSEKAWPCLVEPFPLFFILSEMPGPVQWMNSFQQHSTLSTPATNPVPSEPFPQFFGSSTIQGQAFQKV